MTHGNEGNRVKNLKHTTGCPHSRGHEADRDSNTKCAVNGCNNKGNNACHVTHANQNEESGKRYLVNMCTKHNAAKDTLNIRENAKMTELKDCNCGEF
ncbi:hypothetical protein ABK040_007264 [Willaertia magna]